MRKYAEKYAEKYAQMVPVPSSTDDTTCTTNEGEVVFMAAVM